MGSLQELGWVLPERLLPLQVSVWLRGCLPLGLCLCSAAGRCQALAASTLLCSMLHIDCAAPAPEQASNRTMAALVKLC